MDRPTVDTDRLHGPEPDDAVSATTSTGGDGPWSSGSPNGVSRRRAIAPLLTLLLLVNLAASLYQLPLTKVVERRLCRDWYLERISPGPPVWGPDGQVDESLCKIREVQVPLAEIQQRMDVAWIAGDLAMTIPLGFVAEKYGRRTVLLLNLVPRVALLTWAVAVGYFQDSIPIGAIVYSPWLSFLGGDCVFNSITYALAASLTDENVLRASYFGYMSSISYAVALLGPALASATMSTLIWLPFFIGLFLLLIAVRAIAKLPGDPAESSLPSSITRSFSASPPPSDEEEQGRPLVASPVLKAQDQLRINTTHQRLSVPRAILQRFQVLYGVFASRPRNFVLLLLSMFLTSLASADTKLLVQYISKRYGWTFASAGYLISGKAVVNFFLLTVFVPALLKSRKHRPERGTLSPDGGGAPRRSVERTNIHDANVCLVISVIGALAIGFADIIWLLVPGLLIYALGSALPIFTLSLLKSPHVFPSASPASPLSAITPSSAFSSTALLASYRRGEDDGDRNDGGESHETTVFSVVMIVKTIGSLVGVPVVTSLWIRGIDLDGLALGMPYFASSAFYVVAIAVIAAIRVD